MLVGYVTTRSRLLRTVRVSMLAQCKATGLVPRRLEHIVMDPAVSTIATPTEALTISSSAELARRAGMNNSMILGRLLLVHSLSSFHSLPMLFLCSATVPSLVNLTALPTMERTLTGRVPPMILCSLCIRTRHRQRPRRWFRVATSSHRLMFSLHSRRPQSQ